MWPHNVHFPLRCLFCGATTRGTRWCRDCYRELPWNDVACRRCGTPLATAAVLCGQCLRLPPALDAACCAFRYVFPVNRLVTQLKFNGQLGYARDLGVLLADHIRCSNTASAPEAIVPVPLHPARLRQRGFNQSIEIARRVGRELGLPVLSRVCMRRRNTAPQTALNGNARRRNVRGAFSVMRRPQARHLAIIDDVVTTGATARELATTLRAAGAESITLWAPARA